MDDENENDQIIQEVERNLKIRQETTTFQNAQQVEKSWRNPYSGEQRFKLIYPMFDMVMNQMNVISTCFAVHARIAFTEEEEKKLSNDITQIPQQLSDILFESACIRNNLIDIIGAMERLSNGIAKFVKIANNQKFQDKSLVKFLHYMETPGKDLKDLLEKACELDAQKVATLEKNLANFMKSSGYQTIPAWIEEQAQCKKELEALENERQRKFLEDIAEYDEIARIISEMEFFQTKLAGHENLMKDLQDEKKMLQDNRDYLENQARASATSSIFVKLFFFMRNDDLDVLRKQKTFIKREISDITIQEDQKILHEAECKKALASLTKKLWLAKQKFERAKINREDQLKRIDEKIEKKKKEVKRFEERILQVLKKYDNPSINATCLLLESIARLAKQRTQGAGVSASNRIAVKSFLEEIENEISYIRDTEGDRDLLDDEWLSTFETSTAPLNYFVSEIRPIIRNSIHGISPEGLAEYSAGKALEPAFNSNLRIED